MIIVASTNGSVGIDAGWDVLSSGGSAIDAVEAATRIVEDNPDDHTVGFSGYPNLLGEVELDASIMEGATRRAGAVGALRGYREAITVARAVMERLPHVLVVGDGAARLAAELGLEPRDLLTPEAEATWREGIEGRLTPDVPAANMLSLIASLATDPEQAGTWTSRAEGTVNFLAIDSAGHLASGVSTSGWAWKYPGRLGDSPVIGAGNYADDRFGAAACTGWGELAMRSCTAQRVVLGLANGIPIADACVAAIRDLAELGMEPKDVRMQLVAIDRDGNHCAASTRSGLTYIYRSDGMPSFETVSRLHVELQG